MIVQEIQRIISPKKPHEALDFVSTGVGCFAFTLIESVGILSLLKERGCFDENELNDQTLYKNTLAIRSSLLSLCLCNVLKKSDHYYSLTDLGMQLMDYRGLVSMVFEGYGELMAKSVPIVKGTIKHPKKYLNGAAIALSSIQFGERIDPIVTDVIMQLGVKGMICDLGCGSGERLRKICEATSLQGLGLDACHATVEIAKKVAANNEQMTIVEDDVTNLKGAWKEVDLLMQCFMTHDIFPDEKCIQVLNSYHQAFPNLKYFIVIDIVAPVPEMISHMPAYDYVHGLLGIETRQYERFISLFLQSGYEKEIEIATDLPNTYFWVFKPSVGFSSVST